MAISLVDKVVLMHNCNNRKVEPTDYDRNIIRVMQTVLSLFGATVHDYILTNGEEFYYFRENNLIGNEPLLFDGQEIHLK